MSTQSLCSEQKYEKYQNFLSENFHFLDGKIFSIFEKACFRNVSIIWLKKSASSVAILTVY